jgi:hypothetical protein
MREAPARSFERPRIQSWMVAWTYCDDVWFDELGLDAQDMPDSAIWDNSASVSSAVVSEPSTTPMGYRQVRLVLSLAGHGTTG